MRLFLQSFCVLFFASATIAPAYAEKLLFYVDVSSATDAQKKLMPCMHLLENTEKNEALAMAAVRGNYEAAKTLIESGGLNLNAIHGTRTAAEAGYDNVGYTPLQWAILKGNTQIAELLLQQPEIEPCIRSTVRGSTALHIAAKTNNAFIAKQLLEHPKMSCINHRRATDHGNAHSAGGNKGATAKDVAYHYNSTDVFRLLKKAKAKYAFPNSDSIGGRP